MGQVNMKVNDFQAKNSNHIEQEALNEWKYTKKMPLSPIFLKHECKCAEETCLEHPLFFAERKIQAVKGYSCYLQGLGLERLDAHLGGIACDKRKTRWPCIPLINNQHLNT